MNLRNLLCFVCLCAACSGSRDTELNDDLGSGRRDAGALDANTATDAGSPNGQDQDGEAPPDDAAPTALDAELDASNDDAMVDATARDATAPDALIEASLADSGAPLDFGADCFETIAPALSAQTEGVPATGLALWLRADHGVYRTETRAVCAWVDARGAGPALVSGTQRSTFETLGPQGWPAVRFLASQALTTTGTLGIGATRARTFVAVQTLSNTTSRSQAIIQGQSGTPGTYLSIDTNTFSTAGSREGVYVTNNSYDSTAPTSTGTRVHIFGIDFEGGAAVLPSISYRINGQNLTLTRNPGGLGNGTFEDFGDANYTSVGVGQDSSDLELSEVLVYDHVLSSQELSALENALFSRYFPE